MDKLRRLGVKAKRHAEKAIASHTAVEADGNKLHKVKSESVVNSSTIDGSTILVTMPKHEAFGFQLEVTISSVFSRSGFRICVVAPNSFAEKFAKLSCRDMLIAINDMQIRPDTAWDDVVHHLSAGHKSKDPLELLFYREPMTSRNKKHRNRVVRRPRRRLRGNEEASVSLKGQFIDVNDVEEVESKHCSVEDRLRIVEHELSKCKNRNSPRYHRLNTEYRNLLMELKSHHVRRGFGPKSVVPLLFSTRGSGAQCKKGEYSFQRVSDSLEAHSCEFSELSENELEELERWIADASSLLEPCYLDSILQQESNRLEQAKLLHKTLEQKLQTTAKTFEAMKAKRDELSQISHTIGNNLDAVPRQVRRRPPELIIDQEESTPSNGRVVQLSPGTRVYTEDVVPDSHSRRSSPTGGSVRSPRKVGSRSPSSGRRSPRSNGSSSPRRNAPRSPRSNESSSPRRNTPRSPRSNASSSPRKNSPRSHAPNSPRKKGPRSPNASNAPNSPKSDDSTSPRSNSSRNASTNITCTSPRRRNISPKCTTPVSQTPLSAASDKISRSSQAHNRTTSSDTPRKESYADVPPVVRRRRKERKPSEPDEEPDNKLQPSRRVKYTNPKDTSRPMTIAAHEETTPRGTHRYQVKFQNETSEPQPDYQTKFQEELAVAAKVKGTSKQTRQVRPERDTSPKNADEQAREERHFMKAGSQVDPRHQFPPERGPRRRRRRQTETLNAEE